MISTIDTVTLEFLDQHGGVLARGSLSSDILNEGQHRQVKTYPMSAVVTRKGRLDQYRFVSSVTGEALLSPNGVKMQGEVREGPTAQPFAEDGAPNDPDVVMPFFLDHLNVNVGERISGVFRTFTITEDHMA